MPRQAVRDERGDLISSWLLQLLVVMALVAVVGYEMLTVTMTGLTLDRDADEIADAAADAYGREGRLDQARAAADGEAAARGATVEDVPVDGDVVVVTVRREADTRLLHHVAVLERFWHPAATRREAWRP